MYRTADTSLRCPMCGMTNLTPPTCLLSGEGSNTSDTRLSFDVRTPGDRFALLQAAFPVKRARACLDCGHVALALAPEDLEQMRSRLPSLHPR